MPVDQTWNTGPRVVGTNEAPDKVEDSANESDGLESKLNQLQERLISHCTRILEASQIDRAQIDVGGAHGMEFQTRYAWEKRKANNEVDVSWNSIVDGSDDTQDVQQYVSGGLDMHCIQGLGAGYTQESLRHWIAYTNRRMFMLNRRPYTIEPKGYHRQEGDKAKKVLYSVLDHILSAGRFEETARLIPDESGTHGVSILRYEMSVRRQMVRQPDGSFDEEVADLEPHFQLWPLENFYVTDWKCPDVHKQRGIFWVEPGIYLNDLEKDEMVVDLDKGIVAGRFINLDILREKAAEETSTSQMTHSDMPQVSDQSPRVKVEYEGELPIHYLVKEGLLTPEMLSHFRVNVTLDELVTDSNPSGFPKEDNEDQMKMWADKVAQIKIWDVAWVSEADYESSDGQVTFPDSGILIRFEPSRTRTPRNTAYRFGYQPKARRFLSGGIPVVGRHAEREAEILYNANAQIKAQMGLPNYLFDASKFNDEISSSVVQRLLRGFNSIIPVTNNSSLPNAVNDALFQMPVTPILNYEVGMADSKNRFENASGIGAAIKSGGDAAPSTGTASEMEANIQTSQLRLDDTLVLAGKEFGHIAKDVVEDLEFTLGFEGLVSYASRISGEAASDIAKWFQTIGNIADEFFFDHPLHALQDQTVLATLIMRLWQVTGGAAFGMDAQHLARIIFDVSGMPNQTERLMGEMQYGSPEDEHSQMRQGNSVDPEIDENIAQHFQAHMQRFDVLKKMLGEDPENIETVTEASLLSTHLQQTIQNKRLVAEAEMAGMSQQLGQLGGAIQAPRQQITQGGGQSKGGAGGGTKDQNEGGSAPSTPRNGSGESAQVKGQGGNSE